MQKTKSNLYLTLTTECLTLRKPELRDAAQFAAIRSNDAVNRYLDRQSSMNTGDARAFIKTIRNGIKAREIAFNFLKGRKQVVYLGYK